MALERLNIETVVLNGQIVTMDKPGHRVEALAIAQGRIVARGSTDEIRALAPHAAVIDCEGRTVLPGIVDSHCHPDMHGARIGRWYDFFDGRIDTRDKLLALVRAETKDKPHDSWFTAYRFDEMHSGGYPTLDELDAASGGRPVFIYRRDAHMGVASSAALKAVGFHDTASDPAFGRIERDPATGRPTGLLRARAAHIVIEHIQAAYTAEDFRSGLVKVLDEYLSFGITSVHNSLTTSQAISAYQTMRQNGELKTRIGILASGRDDDLVRAIVRSGMRSGFGDDWIRLIGLEWVGDGSTSGRTAAYYDPYLGEPVLGEPPDNRGSILLDREEYTRRVAEAHAAGLMVCTDAIGDRAIDFFLDVYDDVLAADPRPDHRMRIEHCCNVTPAILARLKRSGVVCSSATGFAYDLGDAYLQNRGADAMKVMWPHRSMIDAGVPAPGHSDAPVCSANPFFGISAMVNRQTQGGRSIDQSEAVTVHEALEAYTRLGAWCGREEQAKGDLGLGKLADLCILDRDPFAIPPLDLANVTVLSTMVDGAIVFDRR
ncbi:amidohydrolase [Microvirga antarctica]|uniref:amidohydrolase n=1 Tax=Microvirga antarctica TaxID=2819233 RepID=UPI001B30DDF7|nr:amidohydrolase [Microvirga antarctica]